MSVSLYAFTCGELEGEFGRVMEGAEGRVTMPIPVFLIEHPKGQVLFDSGLHPDCQHDPVGRLGERMTSIYRIRFAPGEEISARLEAIDRDPSRIDFIVNSRLGLIPLVTVTGPAGADLAGAGFCGVGSARLAVLGSPIAGQGGRWRLCGAGAPPAFAGASSTGCQTR
jgi:hypothetical protein